MLRNIILAVIVGVAVTLACVLAGTVLVALEVSVAVAVGGFLKDWAGAIGVLAGLWYFFAGGTFLGRQA